MPGDGESPKEARRPGFGLSIGEVFGLGERLFVPGRMSEREEPARIPEGARLPANILHLPGRSGMREGNFVPAFSRAREVSSPFPARGARLRLSAERRKRDEGVHRILGLVERPPPA